MRLRCADNAAGGAMRPGCARPHGTQHSRASRRQCCRRHASVVPRRLYDPGVEYLTVVVHPLAGHLLAELRDVRTEPERFRTIAQRLATVLVLEATRGLDVTKSVVETPLTEAKAHFLARAVVAVPILRAGLGLLDA